jgi:protein disulfide-isomerase
MKKLVLSLICALGLSLPLSAQTHGTQEWLTDVNVAIQKSAESGKPIFLFFTGSDWCGWCIRLQNEVFHSDKFSQWAKENVILVELDFPRRKALPVELQNQNNTMQQIFQVQGFPTVHFVTPQVNSDSTVNFLPIGQSGYLAGGPDAWIANANSILKQR